MSFRGKRELLVQVAPRYSSARHGQRSVILDEFVAVTGYERKYAIRLLLGPIRPPGVIRRPRAPHYGLDVQAALSVAVVYAVTDWLEGQAWVSTTYPDGLFDPRSLQAYGVGLAVLALAPRNPVKLVRRAAGPHDLGGAEDPRALLPEGRNIAQ